jgi:hypothetical protein
MQIIVDSRMRSTVYTSSQLFHPAFYNDLPRGLGIYLTEVRTFNEEGAERDSFQFKLQINILLLYRVFRN